MKQLNFSNSNIDLACEEVGSFLLSSGVEKREALRIKLTLEEMLLEYQENFGEEALFTVKCVKRFLSIKVELTVEGHVYNPLEKGAEENAINSILAGIGLAPSYVYKNGKNCIVFTPKRKPLSSTLKMGVAIVLGVISGIVLNLLPEEIKNGANGYVLTPMTDVFMGLISATSVPLIFLSVLGSICSMGNMETLGKIGKKTIKAIVIYMAVISLLATVVASLFYKVELGGGGEFALAQILELIYDIFPTNIFESFVSGNTLQLIFIATIIGLAMIFLSSRVSGVFGLVEQFTAIAQTIMVGLSSLLPIFLFVLFAGIISGGELGALIDSWKIIVVFLILIAAYYVFTFLYISAKKQVPPGLLMRKTWKTFMIALTTASSAAAFSTNVKDSRKKLGIDKRLVDFGIPIGQVLFDPAGIISLVVIELTMAQIYSIPITPAFLAIAYITNMLISLATPPVPGGGIMMYAIAFAQLGIPMEAMGVVLVVDMITDFPITACNVTGWQLTLIDVADSLNMLDKDTLRKEK